MAYDPNYPADHALIVAADFRNQFNGLMAVIEAQQGQLAALQQQLAPLVPVLNRSAGGQWTVAFAGTAPITWLVWSRYPGNEAWFNSGEADFPVSDDALSPGTAWWQIKICGEGVDGKPSTLFSNIISVGPVPA